MNLGAFSISLPVADLAASVAFYQTLGFERFGGSDEFKYAIMKNDETLIGLFQGMFDQPMLTFNPGWDQAAGEVNPFDDVRSIKAALKESGLRVVQEQGSAEGPASFMVIDPDGHPILIDQHR